jgi:uncharacterized OB-fold protein
MIVSPVKIWRNQKKMQRLLGLKGRVLSYTCVRVPPSAFKAQAPYPVALVRLANRKVIIAQVVDASCDKVKKGQRVVVVLRKVTSSRGEGIIPYGLKVKLI